MRLAFHFVANVDTPFDTAKKYPGMKYIHVEPHDDGAIVVACDGAWMFLGIDEDGYCDEPVNVELAVPVHMKLRHGMYARVTAIGSKGRLKVARSKHTLAVQEGSWVAEDQDYPDWRAVVPDAGRLNVHFPACISSVYLAKIGRLWDDTDQRLGHAVFLGKGEKQATCVHFPKMPNVMLVGMPLDDLPELPGTDWSEAFKQPAPEIDDDL
ncbi:DNA polymerase III B subunit [Burkholderia phage vB_BceS_AH2]|uniref:DNA polymerase III B subunit n=1 Tax=Burkholderia phage vB_BceS_AH2 TaxID=1133022 RepID=I6NLH9_9CAUD|nr:RusA-like Holliday junction resolvase [Burkholderia phage vB_BceS_AH2]AEY69530.1 DNA polymerase III B subunit [Burkholderia phage vB_BceS_AH2]